MENRAALGAKVDAKVHERRLEAREGVEGGGRREEKTGGGGGKGKEWRGGGGKEDRLMNF